MSEHLEKARAALTRAGEINGNSRHHTFKELLDIAQVQAQVAQAEALHKLANILDARLGGC